MTKRLNISLVGAVFLVFLAYAWLGILQHRAEFAGRRYLLLAEGFRTGRLGLAADPPASLMNLPDPYDCRQNQEFRYTLRGHDLSLYRGRLYVCHGPLPMLFFFPAYLAGLRLPDYWGVFAFVCLGFLGQAALLAALWRKYFQKLRFWLFPVSLVMLGLTQPGRLLFNRPSFYEAASASAYAAAAWAFFFLWKYAETGALKWLTWFSFLLGLSLAGRPTLAFGAAAVIAAVIWKLRLSRPNRKTDHLFWKALLALGLPAAAVAALLGLYNLERFDSIWETGYRFQLTACGNKMTELTTLGQLPQRCLSNFFTYFFLPWGQSWPVSVWPLNWLPPLLPVTRYEALKGFFYCAPYGWMLLTLPLLWRHQSAKLQNLVGFTKVLALFSAVNLLFNISLGGITQRYAVEFGPMLCSLAVLALWWMEFARRKGQKVNLVMAPLLLLAVWSVGVNLFY